MSMFDSLDRTGDGTKFMITLIALMIALVLVGAMITLYQCLKLYYGV